MDAGVARRAELGLVAWCVALVVGTASFHALGAGALAAPSVDPRGWVDWVAGRDPLVASVALLRLVVLALHWYLVGATAAGIVARLLHAASLVRLADAVTVPALRRLLEAGLGLWLATALAASVVVPRDAPDRVALGPEAVVTVAASGPEATADGVGGVAPSGHGASTVTGAGGADAGPVDGRPPPEPLPPLGLLDATRAMPPGSSGPSAGGAPTGGSGSAAGGAPSGTSSRSDWPMPPGRPVEVFGGGVVTDAAAGGPAVAGVDDDPGGGSVGRGAKEGVAGDHDAGGVRSGAAGSKGEADAGLHDVHVVVAGDSFWRIAEQRLAADGRPPTDAEIVDCMERLIEHNRDRLADPANPDLILPGQRLTLPAAQVAE